PGLAVADRPRPDPSASAVQVGHGAPTRPPTSRSAMGSRLNCREPGQEAPSAFPEKPAGRDPAAPCRTRPPMCRRETRPELSPADTGPARPAQKSAPAPGCDVRYLAYQRREHSQGCRSWHGRPAALPQPALRAATAVRSVNYPASSRFSEVGMHESTESAQL